MTLVSRNVLPLCWIEAGVTAVQQLGTNYSRKERKKERERERERERDACRAVYILLHLPIFLPSCLPVCLSVYDKVWGSYSRLFFTAIYHCGIATLLHMWPHFVDAFEPIIDELALGVESARLPKEADLDM